jgi:hypothetical protein
MSSEHRLQNVLKNPRVWIAGQSSVVTNAPIPTGFAALDEKLGGGWPVGALTEILLDGQGIGELRCLMPALARLTQDSGTPSLASSKLTSPSSSALGLDIPTATRLITWIAPPHIPYAPALAQQGLDVAKLLVVRTAKSVDALWAMEQALRSNACMAAFAWFHDVDDRSLRRIQLAAEAGQNWAVIFRPARYAQSHSPAALRIQLKFVVNGPVLNIIRNRYGDTGTVCLPHC